MFHGQNQEITRNFATGILYFVIQNHRNRRKLPQLSDVEEMFRFHVLICFILRLVRPISSFTSLNSTLFSKTFCNHKSVSISHFERGKSIVSLFEPIISLIFNLKLFICQVKKLIQQTLLHTEYLNNLELNLLTHIKHEKLIMPGDQDRRPDSKDAKLLFIGINTGQSAV